MTYTLGAAKYQLQIKYTPSGSTKVSTRSFGGINAPGSPTDEFITSLRAFFLRAYEYAPGSAELGNFIETRPVQAAA